QAKKEEVVYVTKRGKKYHKEDCRFIKNRETISMDKKEAEAKGLTPCGRCFKEEE
ncbi:nuclease, partial [bacterium]|nr:nuclease [bacterium]